MVICEPCEGESSSLKDRRKASTCEDCIVDNPIVNVTFTKDPCDCHAAGHDKSKIKKTEPIEESLRDEMKSLIVKERNERNVTLYKIKQLEKLKEDASSKELEEIDKQLKKLGEIKILEDDE